MKCVFYYFENFSKNMYKVVFTQASKQLILVAGDCDLRHTSLF